MIGWKASGSLSCAITALMVLWFSVPVHAANGMKTGSVTSQPIGHYEFCKAHISECNVRTADRNPVRLTTGLWKYVLGVNASVNGAVRPMNDIDIYGKDEVWTYPGNVGDCEDFVLEKRRQLMVAGIAASNLLITVVRKWNGEGHAVLTLRTDKGDFVLDNLRDDIRPWTATGYNFLKRQATFHSGKWVTISEPGTVFVGSVGKD
jgi:predicted transglutaminase-like cysteine proteinase